MYSQRTEGAQSLLVFRPHFIYPRLPPSLPPVLLRMSSSCFSYLLLLLLIRSYLTSHLVGGLSTCGSLKVGRDRTKRIRCMSMLPASAAAAAAAAALRWSSHVVYLA